MKNTFRKAVSVILAVMMLVSLCTVAITSASAETTEVPTLKDFNIVAGQFGDVEPVVADPVVSGGYAVTLNIPGGVRRGFLLSDGTDSAEDGEIDPFAPVDATYYTVRFDYYIESASGSTSFMLYYGAEDPSVPKDGGEIDSTSTKGDAVNTCNDIAYIESVVGDGKWHTGAISFKAVSNRKNGSGTALPYLYLTAYAGTDNGTNHMLGYLKNIEIITETTAVSYSNNEVYLNHFFNEDEDKTANTDMFQVIADDGKASPMTKSYINEDGDYVFVPTSDVLNTAYTSGQNVMVSADYIELLKANGSTYTCTADTGFTSYGNNNRFCLVKYKVVEIGESGFACIGFGRASTTVGSTVVYSSIKETAVSSEWKYASLFMCSNSSGPDLRLSFGGVGSKIVIDSVYYCHTKNANVVLTTFNDNGELNIRVGYKGTDIAYYDVDGANSENIAMGEKFMGWYEDANFSAPTTTFPETSGTVYARYPSTIIDFTHRTSWSANYGANSTTVKATADNTAGTWTVAFSASTGVMIPSYDAAIDDKMAMSDKTYGTRYAAFYQFKEGTKYKITYVYTVSETVSTVSANMLHTPANAAGSAGVRETGTNSSAEQGSLKLEASYGNWTTSTFEFTAHLKNGANKLYTYGEGSDDDIFGIAIRSVNMTVIFDKIIITEVSDETRTGYATRIIADYGDTQEILAADAAVGDLIVMPEALEKADQMFVGWYDSTVDLSYIDAYGANVSQKHIPVAAFRVTEDMLNTTTTYKAHYISTEAEIIDFEESTYQGNDRGGYAWSETPISYNETTEKYSGASCGDRSWPWTIKTDNNEDHYAYIDTVTENGQIGKAAGANYWKIQLFHEDGSYITVYEGVTYEITMKYECVGVDSTSDCDIGISRAVAGGYVPKALDDNSRQGRNIFAKANTLTDDITSAKYELRVEDTYNAYDGNRADGAYTVSSALAVVVRSGQVKIHSVTIKPISYTPTAKIGLKNGTVEIDYENGTVTAIPDTGYEVSSAGVSAIQNYEEYTVTSQVATVEETETEHFNLMPIKDDGTGGSTADGLTFKFDNNIEGAKLSSYRFMVDFVKTDNTTVNAATIGYSVRRESGSGDTYESAGIRFRFRASEQTVANADKIEFVIVPTAALGESTIEAYMNSADNSAAATGVAKDTTRHVVYENVGTYYDYQAILTGLTRDGVNDTRLLDLQLSVAFRVTVGETVTYVELGNSVCYNDYIAN